MKELASPQEVFKNLNEDSLFQDWKKNHPDAILSHFFCPLSSELKVKENWEMGFYDNEKMTVFSVIEKGFAIKPEDDVFKKPQTEVESLDVEKIKISIDDAVATFKEIARNKFSSVVLGDGFLIVQTLNGNSLWNFTFISKSLKFANVKIDASSGEVISSDLINAVSQS
ncbi:PepSY domain-containing protein [Candidatus Woesearchaeota archaeon]|nr:PepSY domain-containing protein [Candidatus Woesearchaeota archaeon]